MSAKQVLAWTRRRKRAQKLKFLGNTIWKFRKSKTNSLKGKTYEEIHGAQKAAQLRENRQTSSVGIKRSTATKKKLSKSAKGRIGKKNPFYGKKHSISTREKISKVRREKFKERQTINKQVRRYWRVRQWTQDVFKRDNYTCQLCDRYGGYLEAHHKKPLHKIIGDLTFEEVIALPELYLLSNGVTLCWDCHMIKTHKWRIK